MAKIARPATTQSKIAHTSRSSMSTQRGKRVRNTVKAHKDPETRAPPTVLYGSPEYLSIINPSALRDIKDFILDKTGTLGVGKIGQELTNPTGTKFVFRLCLDEDEDEGNEWHITKEMKRDIGTYIEGTEVLVPSTMLTIAEQVQEVWHGEFDDDETTSCQLQELGHGIRDYTGAQNQEGALYAPVQVDLGDAADTSDLRHHIGTTIISNKTETTKTSDSSLEINSSAEAARKARLMRSHEGISLASLIAAADSDEPPIVEVVGSYSTKTSPTAPKDSITELSSRISPDEDDTSPEVARASHLPRSKGTISLAALIAAASQSSHDSTSDSDSDSDTDYAPSTATSFSENIKSGRPCYDPGFPGHAPCTTHRMRMFGRSRGAAVQLLRDRFEARCAATGFVGWRRRCSEVKRELGGRGMAMVHRGSRLRFGVSVDGEGNHGPVDEGEVYDEDGQLVICDEANDCHARGDTLLDFPMVDSSNSFEEDIDCPRASEVDDDWDASVDVDKDVAAFDDGVLLESSCPFNETGVTYEEATASEEKYGEDEDNEGYAELKTQIDAADHILALGTLPNTPTVLPRIIHINKPSERDGMSDKTSMQTSIFSRVSGTTTSSRESHTTMDRVCAQLFDALQLDSRIEESDKIPNSRSAVHMKVRAPSSASSHADLFDDFDFEFDFEAAMHEQEILFIPVDYSPRGSGIVLPSGVANDETVAGPHFYDLAMPPDKDFSSNKSIETLHTPSRHFQWTRKITQRAKEVPKKIKKVKYSIVNLSKHFTHTLAGFIPAMLAGRHPFQRT